MSNFELHPHFDCILEPVTNSGRMGNELLKQKVATTIGHFIKMGRFDKTLEGFRKDPMSHGKTYADI
jgi:hypothetical protein